MRKILKITLFLMCLTALMPLVASAQKWTKLFDGKTLNGWHTIVGGKWQIKKGVIVGTSPASETRHGLLISDKTFTDFEVEISYKAIKGNSGLYFRAEKSGNGVGVYGFQAEIDPQKDAGGLYETGGRAWVVQPTPQQVASWYKPNKWNTMKVRAVGNDVTVWVNGKQSAALKNDPGRQQGHIALQLHGSQEMEVMFRSVKIREL